MKTQMLPLGKAPARKNSIKLAMENYVTIDKLPVVPKVFGHEMLIDSWGMLGNDQYGDCVWAGASHETMLWNAMNSTAVEFTTADALEAYSRVTGFDPSQTDANGNNPTDNGTDMQLAAKFRQAIGIEDAAGTRHTIDVYVALKKRSIKWVATAAYVFGAVGVGIRFPSTAMDQFNQGKPWSYVPFSSIEGGHYVPVIGRAANGNLLCVTWGQVQEMTPTFFKMYNDENVAYLSLEALHNQVTLEGFNVSQLEQDLQALKTQA